MLRVLPVPHDTRIDDDQEAICSELEYRGYLVVKGLELLEKTQVEPLPPGTVEIRDAGENMTSLRRRHQVPASKYLAFESVKQDRLLHQSLHGQQQPRTGHPPPSLSATIVYPQSLIDPPTRFATLMDLILPDTTTLAGLP